MQTAFTRPSLRPARALVHPLWWCALALLLLNDHVFKIAGVLPRVVTGKLSDFAGLLVAPVLLAVIVRARSTRAVAACFGAVAAWLVAVKLSPDAASACERVMGAIGVPWRIWVDPSDLLALPALVVGWRVLVPPMHDAGDRRTSELLLACLGAVACVATSAARPPRAQTAGNDVVAQAWHSTPVHVIDAQTGARRVRVDVDGTIEASAIVGDVLYIASSRAVRGYDMSTGGRVVEHERDRGYYDQFLAADDDRLYLLARSSGDGNDQLEAVNRRTGKTAWNVDLSTRGEMRDIAQGPRLGAGLLLVPTEDKLEAYEPATGRKSWTFTASATVRAVTAHGAIVYAGDAAGVLFAVDALKGGERWRLATGDEDAFVDRYWPGGSRLRAAAGVVLYQTEAELVAVDAQTRGARWHLGGVHHFDSGDRQAVVQLEDEVIAAVDLESGRVLWRQTLDEGFVAAPVVAETQGVVLVRPHSSLLYALEIADGRVRWKFDLDDGQVVIDD
jgi:outer membrane protein assembly factor BamB